MLNDAADGGEVGGDERRNLRGDDTDKVRAEVVCRCFDVADEFVVAPEDGVVFGEGGDEDQAVVIVPARLVVRRWWSDRRSLPKRASTQR